QHTKDQFSKACPWKSNFSVCSLANNACSISATQCSGVGTCVNGVNETYVVVTPVSSGWNTSVISDGSYTISVKATDHASNKTIKTVPVSVQNHTAGLCPPPVVSLD